MPNLLTDYADLIPTVEATYNEIMAFNMTIQQINEITSKQLSSKYWEQHALKLALKKLVFVKISIQHLDEKIKDEQDFIIEMVESAAKNAHHKGYIEGIEAMNKADNTQPPKVYQLHENSKNNISSRFDIVGKWEQLKGVYVAEQNVVWDNYKHYFAEHFSHTIGKIQYAYYNYISELEPYFKEVFDFAFDKGLEITKEVATSGLYSKQLAVWYPTQWTYGG